MEKQGELSVHVKQRAGGVEERQEKNDKGGLIERGHCINIRVSQEEDRNSWYLLSLQYAPSSVLRDS